MPPSVTVLVAVRNGGDYLPEAVESVFAQSHTDLELLIVDDASDDDTREYLASLDDPRLRVLWNERNIGQVPSLNRGLGEARGKYVARIDADDVMLSSRLARQVAILDSEPRVALVGTWMLVVDDRGRRWGTTRGRIDCYADFVGALLVNRMPFGHPSIMFRRDVVRRLGAYDASLAPSEDKDLYRRLALQRCDVRVVPEALVRYRRHDAQLSQTQIGLQLATDLAGHERFLRELAPDQPARTLRRLLAGDSAFWTEPPLDELESFVDAAARRLHLDPGERDRVARTVASQCARALLTSWTSAARANPRTASALAAFAWAHGGAGVRTTLALHPIARATRPVGVALRRSRTATKETLRRSERLAPLRVRARRSRVLSRVYALLLGFRLVDDGVDRGERPNVPGKPGT